MTNQGRVFQVLKRNNLLYYGLFLFVLLVVLVFIVSCGTKEETTKKETAEREDGKQIIAELSKKPFKKEDAIIIASIETFKPTIAESIGCDPHHFSNPQVHSMDDKWFLVTFDAEIEHKRVYVRVSPDFTAEVMFVWWLHPSENPLCD